MPRVIKFRAWDKHAKRFVYPNLWDSSMPSNWDYWYDLQQHTGLTDKNGKEIYEGDVFHMGDPNIKYVVEWLDCGLKGRQITNKSYVGFSYWQERIEVMGNIYENPELLKSQTKVSL